MWVLDLDMWVLVLDRVVTQSMCYCSDAMSVVCLFPLMSLFSVHMLYVKDMFVMRRNLVSYVFM